MRILTFEYSFNSSTLLCLFAITTFKFCVVKHSAIQQGINAGGYKHRHINICWYAYVFVLNLTNRQMIRDYYFNGAAEAFTLSKMERLTLCWMAEAESCGKYFKWTLPSNTFLSKRGITQSLFSRGVRMVIAPQKQAYCWQALRLQNIFWETWSNWQCNFRGQIRHLTLDVYINAFVIK